MIAILPDPNAIRIAAALLCRADGRTLLVRKRGTAAFMQPGGKIEPHEQPAAALIRELREELGLTVDASAPTHIGRFTAAAANEPGRAVDAKLFRIDITGDVTPAAEIEEVAWIEPSQAAELVLAPLTEHHVLPLCRAQRGREISPT
jgi:8-oxo-dGTP diphosphatase